MNNYYTYCLFTLLSLFITINSAIATPDRQQLLSPNTSSSNTIDLSKNNLSTRSANAKEYTFKAPDNKILTNTEQLKAAQGYKVEVYGSAEELLLQIKNIEPRAFAKGDIIQVGIFKQQKNAEDLVRQLAARGFWARITPQ